MSTRHATLHGPGPTTVDKLPPLLPVTMGRPQQAADPQRQPSLRETLLVPALGFADNGETRELEAPSETSEPPVESVTRSRYGLSIAPPSSELSVALGDVLAPLVRRRSDLPR